MKSAIKISFTYIVLSSIWIIFSDRLINGLTNDALVLTKLASLKGLFFVTVTGIILYLQVRNEIKIKNKIIAKLDEEIKIKRQLIRELHHRIKNNLQAILGLINIEVFNDNDLERFKERITSKIISMVSVFNIVYDMRDLSKISIGVVLKEYVRNSKIKIKIDNIIMEFNYSIETITSCILLVDTIMEACCRIEDNMLQFELSLPEAGRIILKIIKNDLKQKIKISNTDNDFIETQLQSVNGKYILDERNQIINIYFQDKY